MQIGAKTHVVGQLGFATFDVIDQVFIGLLKVEAKGLYQIAPFYVVLPKQSYD